MTKISRGEYEVATRGYQGWCTACCDFTRDSTEPDAEGYDCPVCGGDTVVGAEQALLCEEFVVVPGGTE